MGNLADPSATFAGETDPIIAFLALPIVPFSPIHALATSTAMPGAITLSPCSPQPNLFAEREEIGVVLALVSVVFSESNADQFTHQIGLLGAR